jgi:signal transduction histidine kinase
MLGLQANVEGQPVSAFLPDFDWRTIARFDAEGGRGVVRHEFEVQYPRPRFLRLYAAPLDGPGPGADGVALILHDATEARKQTFEAIESERIQALTLLAASVAHEIGNPLNALHIHLQLMEREVRKLRQLASGREPRRTNLKRPSEPSPDLAEITDKLGHYLDVSKGEIDRLDYIVTQFLNAIRPVPPQLKPTSLNEVVEKTVELLKPELDNRGLHLRLRLARELSRAPLDATQIQQVLVNLVKNAMHATTRDGTITLQTGENSDGVWVSVADTGSGIPEDKLNRIFEPFTRRRRKAPVLGS